MHSDPDVLALPIKHMKETGGPEPTNAEAPKVNKLLESSPLPECDNTIKWNESTTKLLLETYKKVDGAKCLVKNKWAKIAQEVNKTAGTNFPAEKCRLKIKTIQEKFKGDKANSTNLYPPDEGLFERNM